MSTAARFSLEAVAVHFGISAMGRPEADGLADQALFTVTIPIVVPDGTFLETATGHFSVPESILATFRLHRTTKTLQVTAFEMGDRINAFTVLGGLRCWSVQILTMKRRCPGRALGPPGEFCFEVADAITAGNPNRPTPDHLVHDLEPHDDSARLAACAGQSWAGVRPWATAWNGWPG